MMIAKILPKNSDKAHKNSLAFFSTVPKKSFKMPQNSDFVCADCLFCAVHIKAKMLAKPAFSL